VGERERRKERVFVNGVEEETKGGRNKERKGRNKKKMRQWDWE
jgi:hypothetical protein